MTGTYNFDGDSSDEELTFEELAATYKELCTKSVEICQDNDKQKKLILQLQDIKQEHLEIIKRLESEVTVLKCDLDQMTKNVKMLNSGSETLDKILQAGKIA